MNVSNMFCIVENNSLYIQTIIIIFREIHTMFQLKTL